MAITLFLSSFIWAGEHRPTGKTLVFVSISPQAYFVEQVGGSQVTVEVLIGSGQSPVTYDPTPRQMSCLAEASILFTVGLPFEKRLLEKIKSGFDNLEIVDTRRGIELLAMDHDDHGHTHAGNHDPHIWLDPSLVKVQAENICKALSVLLPDQRPTFESNLRSFQGQLDSIAATIRQELSDLKRRTIYVFHPTYGYFCNAFDLEQVAIEMDGKEPSARQLAELVDSCRKDSVRTIFVQPQFSRKAAQAVAEAIGGEVIPLDPLARNYIDNLVEISAKIAAALGARAGDK